MKRKEPGKPGSFLFCDPVLYYENRWTKTAFLHQISHQIPKYTKNYTKKSSENVQEWAILIHKKRREADVKNDKKVPDFPRIREKSGTLPGQMLLILRAV